MVEESTAVVAAPAAASPKKAAKKAAGPKKPVVKPTHPAIPIMVNAAIGTLKERGGSSLLAIKKYLAANYKVDVEKKSHFIKKYLKGAVVEGKLIQTKGKGATGSFKLPATEKKTAAKKAAKPAAKKSAEKKPKAVAKKAATDKKKKAATKKPAAAGAAKKKAAASGAKAAKKAGAVKAAAKPKPKAKPAKPAAKPKAAAAAKKAPAKKAAPKKAAAKKIFFLISFVVSLCLAINFIYNIYSKWSLTPVIIATNASPTYINQIPFPAVTICNMNQALRSKVENLDKKSTAFSILQTLCSRPDETNNLNVSNDWSVVEHFLVTSTQRCRDMLRYCKFGYEEFICSDLFKPVLTDEGRCCSFNTVDAAFMFKNYTEIDFGDVFMPKEHIAVDWTPESGYPSILPKKFYPTTGVGTGSSMGLTVIVDADIKNYYCSSTNGAGFKVLLHNPTESPDVGDSGISIKAGYESRVVITPQISDASPTLRDMDKYSRQCLFANEEDLSFYRTYTRRNCEDECQARLIAEKCDCVYYYMPKISPNISICGIKDINCVEQFISTAQVANQNDNNCTLKCIPGCFDLFYVPASYSAAIAQGNFTLRDRIVQNLPEGYAATNIAVLHVYYIENAFRSNKKEQFVGFTEFLSSTGGLMGLFIGFSIVSVMEIIYYASFRPFFAYRRYKAERPRPNSKKKMALQRFYGTLFRKNLIEDQAQDELSVKQFKRMQGFEKTEGPYSNVGYYP